MHQCFPGLTVFELTKILIPINRDMSTHWSCLSIDRMKKVSKSIYHRSMPLRLIWATCPPAIYLYGLLRAQRSHLPRPGQIIFQRTGHFQLTSRIQVALIILSASQAIALFAADAPIHYNPRDWVELQNRELGNDERLLVPMQDDGWSCGVRALKLFVFVFSLIIFKKFFIRS